MRWIGGKNHAGTYQRIINLIPPHEVYVEGFLGSGAILRGMLPAKKSIGLDKASRSLELCDRCAPNLTLLQEDFLEWFRVQSFDAKTMIYLDPPYLLSTRGGRLEKRRRRWVAKFEKMPACERAVIYEAIREVCEKENHGGRPRQ